MAREKLFRAGSPVGLAPASPPHLDRSLADLTWALAGGLLRAAGRDGTARTAALKAIRRLGTPLPSLIRKEAERRPYPPGAHGVTPRRRPSEYRRRLEEKQKVRLHYGVTESQLRHAFAATRGPAEAPGATRLAQLERRLDNVVFRLGLAATIPAARQLVAHGHVQVNGRRVDRPAYLVEVGDALTLSPRGRGLAAVRASVE
jgi:small subunit ribosomal protein S4